MRIVNEKACVYFQAQNDCERLEDELADLQDKDSELTVQEEMLVVETNDMQTAIETKEFRRDALIKNASIMHPQVITLFCILPRHSNL